VPLSQCCGCLLCGPGVIAALLPHLSGTVIVGVREVAGRVVLLVRDAAAEAACPGCGAVSGRVHSRYQRLLRDAPAGGRPVVICLVARRFFCPDPACPKVTFAAQVEGLTSRYARRTPPLAAALGAVAAALCGRAGARLGAVLGAPASRQAMIRLVMAAPVTQAGVPQVLGVDDFALRKGHVYGTVLIGMQPGGGVVDLLPDREAATLRDWLHAHPGAAVICRDRGGAYADGARQGAPDAVQVADRWHLWHNLGEKARQTVTAHLRDCLASPASPGQPPPAQPPPACPDPPPPAPGRKLTLAERTRRRHAEVAQLTAAGHSLSATAHILRLSRPTVRKYAEAAAPADLHPAAAQPALDPFKPRLISQWNQGTRDPAALHADITARGYTGPPALITDFTAPFRDLPVPRPAPPPPPARDITRWLMTHPRNLTPGDTAALTAITTACPHLAALRDHIAAFATMMTSRTGATHLDTWLATAEASGLPALQSFASGIRADHTAVRNALTMTWNSGKVEGTVNKIKMLKRQTYGRASFPLLRQRVLLTTRPP